MSELPERDPSRPAERQGLFRKFEVERVDGRHPNCTYFVLDLDCDPHAAAAIEAYVASCGTTHPKLANDLMALLEQKQKESLSWS